MSERETLLNARVNELEQELARLHHSKTASQAIQSKVVGNVSSLTWQVVAGTNLNSALEALLARLEARESPTPKELAEVLAALIRRFVRVGLVAMMLALIPGIVAIVQTSLLANQNRIMLNEQWENLLYARLGALASADGTGLRIADGLKKFEFQHEVLGKLAKDVLGYAFGDAEAWAMMIERNVQLLVFFKEIHADLYWAAIQARNLDGFHRMEDSLIQEVVEKITYKLNAATKASKREQDSIRTELINPR